MFRACLPLLLVAAMGCASGRRAPVRSADRGADAPRPQATPWVYPPSWVPLPMSFNSATPDRWYVQTGGGRMLCETPCSTWVPPDSTVELQHADDSKTVLRISKKRLASFEGRPAGIVVKREKSYTAMVTLIVTGVAAAGLGAVFVGFGAGEDCEHGGEAICGTGVAFISTGAILGVVGAAIGGRWKATYELEEVPPWFMGQPGVPPPFYVPPAELQPMRPPPPAARRRTPAEPAPDAVPMPPEAPSAP
jgi:hypothetical protein